MMYSQFLISNSCLINSEINVDSTTTQDTDCNKQAHQFVGLCETPCCSTTTKSNLHPDSYQLLNNKNFELLSKLGFKFAIIVSKDYMQVRSMISVLKASILIQSVEDQKQPVMCARRGQCEHLCNSWRFYTVLTRSSPIGGAMQNADMPDTEGWVMWPAPEVAVHNECSLPVCAMLGCGGYEPRTPS